MEINRKTRFQLRLQNVIFLLLLLCVIGLLAWLSVRYDTRSDWTAGQRNTLSEASQRLLEQLDSPVEIRAYLADDEGTRSAVEEVLQRYQRVKSDIHYQILNPDLAIAEAKTDNIQRYGETVIRYGDREQRIGQINEQNISNALLCLSRDAQRHVVFLSGHNERDPFNDANTGYSTLAQRLQEQGFVLSKINLLQAPIPADTRVLVIAAPESPLLPGEVTHIIRHLENGGQLLWLQDPGDLQGLDDIARWLGIGFVNGVVADNDPTLRSTLGIQHPAILPVLNYANHAITREVRYHTLLPIAVAIDHRLVSPEWQSTALLLSQSGAWAETGGLLGDITLDVDQGDTAGPLTIGLALERPLNDANRARQQRVVIIGDSDFLANTYLGAGANLSLGLNVLNWLSQDDALMNIEPQNAPDRQLQLSKTELAVIGFGFLIILPLGLIAAGGLIWYKRHRG